MYTPQIPFSLNDQIGDNWCWLAIAVDIKRHFDSSSALTKCELAQQLVPGATGCCTHHDTVPRRCDKPGALDNSLSAVDELAPGPGPNPLTGTIPFSQVQALIDAGLPVCIRIGWDGDPQFNGHFIIITGYRVAGKTNKVFVQDPLWGTAPTLYSYHQVATNYLSADGVWTHTYFVKG